MAGDINLHSGIGMEMGNVVDSLPFWDTYVPSCFCVTICCTQLGQTMLVFPSPFLMVSPTTVAPTAIAGPLCWGPSLAIYMRFLFPYLMRAILSSSLYHQENGASKRLVYTWLVNGETRIETRTV